MKKWLFRSLLLLLSPALVVAIYLIAALVGGIIPGSFNNTGDHTDRLEKPIYLTANLLHTDIAIPVNSLTLQQFAFLREAGFPLDNPSLEYLVFGWGAREFYTNTGEYSDIKLKTAWKAITGDTSVMHVAPAGDLSAGQDLIKVRMSNEAFAGLMLFIRDSFALKDGKPVLLKGKTFGFGDVFYEANGHFNIFNPCNNWVSEAFAEAGFGTGMWTPTAYSFELGYRLYN